MGQGYKSNPSFPAVRANTDRQNDWVFQCDRCWGQLTEETINGH